MLSAEKIYETAGYYTGRACKAPVPLQLLRKVLGTDPSKCRRIKLQWRILDKDNAELAVKVICEE